MQKKEDSAHQPDQPVSNSPKWIKKLTMIPTSVLLLTMFGLGGYWLGARQQQSSPTDLLTKPKPSWLPTATPLQQLSVTPTITISQTGQTAGWKTYTNTDLGISITHPSNVYLHREGYEDTEQLRQVWSISWGNMESGKLKGADDPNTTGIKLKDLHTLNYYSIFISVDNNPVYQAPYSATKEPISEKNLTLLLGMGPSKPSRTTFQGRPAVRDEGTFVSGYAVTDIGGSVDYFILDGQRVIPLSGNTYSLNKVPISAIDQILSTFKFL